MKSRIAKSALAIVIVVTSVQHARAVITTDQTGFTFGVYAENVFASSPNAPGQTVVTNNINTGNNSMTDPGTMYAYFWGAQKEGGSGSAFFGVLRNIGLAEAPWSEQGENRFKIEGTNIVEVLAWSGGGVAGFFSTPEVDDWTQKYDFRFVIDRNNPSDSLRPEYKLSTDSSWIAASPSTVNPQWPLSVIGDSNPIYMAVRADVANVSVEVIELSDVDKASFEVIPEPSSCLLTVLGAASLMLMRRRRSR